jgi:hypothetical protein
MRRITSGLLLAGLFSSMLVSTPASAAQVGVTSFDCRYNAESRTFDPVVAVTRTDAATDLRVGVAFILMDGATQVATLSSGAIWGESTDAPAGDGHNGVYQLAIGSTVRFTPLAPGTSQTQPIGGSYATFGDGIYGGPPLTDGHSYTIRVRILDFDTYFDTGQYVFDDRPCTAMKSAASDLTDGAAGSLHLNGGAWAKYKTLLDAFVAPQRSLTQIVSQNLTTGAMTACTKGQKTVPTWIDRRGYCWNATDQADTNWYPQGLAGNGESGWTGFAGSALIATWYTRNAPVQTRVSVISAPGSVPGAYGNFLLKEPIQDCTLGCQTVLVDIKSHVGGAAWVGKYLYVPETSKGFRVFDLTRFVQLGSEWVLPQVAFYKQPAGAGLLFSAASTTGAPTAPSILSVEFDRTTTDRRIVSWPVVASTGRLLVSSGSVTASEATVMDGAVVDSVQGIAALGDSLVLSRSWSTQPAYLLRAGVGGGHVIRTGTVIGAEDLTYEPATNRLWTLGERPNSRALVSIQADALPGGCCRAGI